MSDVQVFSASALSLVLVVAGGAKLRSPERFRGALETYGLIPPRPIPVLVVAVPVLELSSAALQWVPALQPAISIGIVAMFAGFTVLLLASLMRHEDADCGCFGTATPEKVSWFSIVRNCTLIVLSLVTVLGGDAPRGNPLPAALAGIGAGLLILLLDQGLTMLLGPQSPRRARS